MVISQALGLSPSKPVRTEKHTRPGDNAANAFFTRSRIYVCDPEAMKIWLVLSWHVAETG